MSEKNLHVSDEVFGQLAARAAREGRSIDEIAEESLRAALREKSWQSVLERGRKYGKASGLTEDKVPDTVREYRQEHRGR